MIKLLEVHPLGITSKGKSSVCKVSQFAGNCKPLQQQWSFPGDSAVKNLPVMQETQETCVHSITGLGRSPGGGYGDLLQYYSLENSMDRGAWQATVHMVAKSWTQLKPTEHTHSTSYELITWLQSPAL